MIRWKLTWREGFAVMVLVVLAAILCLPLLARAWGITSSHAAAASRGKPALRCLDALDQQVSVGVVPLVGCKPLVDVIEENPLAVGPELPAMVVKHRSILTADKPTVVARVEHTPLIRVHILDLHPKPPSG